MQAPSRFDSAQKILVAVSAPMGKPRQKPPPKGRDQQQAKRLEGLRVALGYGTQAGFAKFLEIEYARWNNFETGLPLSKDVAFQIVRKIPGMTTDYLFFGKPDGLPIHLARKLDAYPEREA